MLHPAWVPVRISLHKTFMLLFAFRKEYTGRIEKSWENGRSVIVLGALGRWQTPLSGVRVADLSSGTVVLKHRGTGQTPSTRNAFCEGFRSKVGKGHTIKATPFEMRSIYRPSTHASADSSISCKLLSPNSFAGRGSQRNICEDGLRIAISCLT